jgi:hypothetical protein
LDLPERLIGCPTMSGTEFQIWNVGNPTLVLINPEKVDVVPQFHD